MIQAVTCRLRSRASNPRPHPAGNMLAFCPDDGERTTWYQTAGELLTRHHWLEIMQVRKVRHSLTRKQSG